MSAKNPHEGHRKRLRDRYLREGIDGFEIHQVLELLLFYGIPQRDTNPIAHRLLDEFGSLSMLLDASPERLRESGLSDYTIALIKLIPDVARLYFLDRKFGKDNIVDASALCNYFSPRFVGRGEEVVELLLLDTKFKELYSGVVSKGDLSSAEVPIRKILHLCLNTNARYAVIAHNHLSGLTLPSSGDIVATNVLFKALKTINVKLLDHIIVGDGDSVSLAESKRYNTLLVQDSTD